MKKIQVLLYTIIIILGLLRIFTHVAVPYFVFIFCFLLITAIILKTISNKNTNYNEQMFIIICIFASQ